MGLFAAAVLLPLSLLHVVVVVVAPAKSAARYASCCGVVVVVVLLLVCLTNLHKQRCTHTYTDTHTRTQRERRARTQEQNRFSSRVFLQGCCAATWSLLLFLFLFCCKFLVFLSVFCDCCCCCCLHVANCVNKKKTHTPIANSMIDKSICKKKINNQEGKIKTKKFEYIWK